MPAPRSPEETRRRQALAERVMGMVAAIAMPLALSVGLHWKDDLLSAGYLGAAQAADAYDLDSDTPFEGFAWPRISGAMIDFLRRERTKLSPEASARMEQAAVGLGAVGDLALFEEDDDIDQASPEDEIAGCSVGVAIGILWLGDASPDPERSLLVSEEKARLRAEIDNLRERDRALIKLRFFEGWKLVKIADHYGIDVDTARKRLAVAMRRFAQRLKDWKREPLALFAPP